MHVPRRYFGNGATLFVARHNQVEVRDAATGKLRREFGDHPAAVVALAVSPDGKRIATGLAGDPAIRVYDLTTYEHLATLTGHDGGTTALAFAPDDATLASTGPDNDVIRWPRPRTKPCVRYATTWPLPAARTSPIWAARPDIEAAAPSGIALALIHHREVNGKSTSVPKLPACLIPVEDVIRQFLEAILSTMHGSGRRTLARLGATLVAVLATSVLSVVMLAAPASAASCATAAHVYAKGPGIGAPYLTKFQSDPIDGDMGLITAPIGRSITLGGNGLKPDEQPFWDVYQVSPGGGLSYVGTNLGSKAGGNCVANERSFLVTTQLFARGQFYVVKATYEPGNSGGVIRQQNHFRVFVTV